MKYEPDTLSQTLKENMSALMDGELEGRTAVETVDVLLESDELRVHWARYHVVRDVLRHKVYPDTGEALRERMHACLADEPLHFPRRRLLPGRWREILKPVAGMALAASVAVVAVLAVRGSDPGVASSNVAAGPAAVQQQRLAVSTSVPVTGAAIPAAAVVHGDGTQRSGPAALRRLHWSTTEPTVANRLNGYLVTHSEHLGGPISGMHPYARIVGYDSTER
jgi:sigma-E factor negative regulatory protein RseA